MRIKKICFITDGYPSDTRQANAFVETLVNAFVDKGIECTVIAPQSVTKSIKAKDKFEASERTRITPMNNVVKVYSPKYISLSVKHVLSFNTGEITLSNFRRVAEKMFKKLHGEEHFDVIYGHFIFPSGMIARYLGEKYRLPSFFAYGENTTYSIDYLGKTRTKKLLDGITGVISVSSENKRVLIANDVVRSDTIDIFPNSIQNSVFFPKDKSSVREKLGLPINAFIVAFVGRFNEVKGLDRLSIALNRFDNVYSIFIGKGNLCPRVKNQLFQGGLKHDDIADYLNASDIFVLPTLAEGCCNAIIEALACGLPVISSNLPFNDDILDDSCSLRIDPSNTEEIYCAIEKLYYDNTLRSKLSAGAVEKSKTLTIDERAEKILEFMECRIYKHCEGYRDALS